MQLPQNMGVKNKSFAVAYIFLCLTVAWLTINVVWWTRDRDAEKLVVPLLLAVAGVCIVWREHRKRMQ